MGQTRFVAQTRNQLDPPAGSPSHGTGSGHVTLHGPFTDEETALSFVEDLHLNGMAGKETYEFLIEAQAVNLSVDAELDPDDA